ncbi:transposase domain-containing protein [Roseibium sp.]|uniref:transposase domain-containing protein n=1 Tax=Roseibium sp. TaxID=1936156 RepID=UPI003B5130D6
MLTEHLIAEIQQALYGKRSEKLPEDDRQLVFEELQIVHAEVEKQKNSTRSGDGTPKRKLTAKRNIGNLPVHLPRIEHAV